MATSTPSEEALEAIVARIRECRLCREQSAGPLPHEPRPVLRASSTARLLVASQAPGVRVHNTGLPFNDASGDRLRAWMGVDRETFYDEGRVAIAPMGFCFPGHDARKGDLPPRRECRRTWHDDLFRAMPQIETILAIGAYAQDYHFTRLGVDRRRGELLADIVKDWRSLFARTPKILPLPHPSWRNNGWLRRNPWFESEVLPALRAEVARLTHGHCSATVQAP